MKPLALITGITGQDGALLAQYLLEKGYCVAGVFRRGETSKFWRLEELNIKNKIALYEIDLCDSIEVMRLLDQTSPAEIYHLAGNSFVADSFHHPYKTLDSDVTCLLSLLDCLRYRNSSAWLFVAGSCEIYSGNNSLHVHEESPELPISPYGVAKSAVRSLCRIYKESYNLNICYGILFNHESALRSRSFVTRKIVYNLVSAYYDESRPPVLLGNLESSRDWSHARDFVEGFHRLTVSKSSGDFVFGSGRLTSIRDFITITASHLEFNPVFVNAGIDEQCIDTISGRCLVKVSASYYRAKDHLGKIAASDKLEKALGWTFSRNIEDIVHDMVEGDRRRLLHV